MNYVLLSVDHVIAVHDYILDTHELQGFAGGKSLDGALGRVENRLNYGLIQDVYSLAASYAAAISQAHCFNDGNKRTAFQVMDLLLELNNASMDWEIESVGQKIIMLAQTKIDEEEFANWLRKEATKRSS